MSENYDSPGPEAETVHACPPDDGGGLFPCCGRTPFEVPLYHRMTLDPALVTCPPSVSEEPSQ